MTPLAEDRAQTLAPQVGIENVTLAQSMLIMLINGFRYLTFPGRQPTEHVTRILMQGFGMLSPVPQSIAQCPWVSVRVCVCVLVGCNICTSGHQWLTADRLKL